MQVGIYAPYNLSETTTAAIRLASSAMSFGHKVKYLVTQERMTGINEYWDGRVISNPRQHVGEWAGHSDRCVWFEPNRRRLEQALSVNSHNRHILAAGWHSLQPDHFDWLHWHDYVVSPFTSIMASLIRSSRDRLLLSSHACPWEGGLVPTPKDSLIAKDSVKFVMPLSSHTQKNNEKNITRFAELLLGNHDNAVLTIFPSRSWSRDAKRKLEHLSGLFKERIRVAPPLPPPLRLPALKVNDCVIAADLKVDYGIHLARYMAMGMPVVAWDIQPNNALVDPEINGVLVPCEHKVSDWGAQTATWDTNALVKVCARLCQDPMRVIALMGSGHLPFEENGFELFWDDMFSSN